LNLLATCFLEENTVKLRTGSRMLFSQSGRLTRLIIERQFERKFRLEKTKWPEPFATNTDVIPRLEEIAHRRIARDKPVYYPEGIQDLIPEHAWRRSVIRTAIVAGFVHPINLESLDQDQTIEFTHDLIRDYFAAGFLRRCARADAERFLLTLRSDYLEYMKWDGPLLIAMELLEDAPLCQRLVEEILKVDILHAARVFTRASLSCPDLMTKLLRGLENFVRWVYWRPIPCVDCWSTAALELLVSVSVDSLETFRRSIPTQSWVWCLTSKAGSLKGRDPLQTPPPISTRALRNEDTNTAVRNPSMLCVDESIDTLTSQSEAELFPFAEQSIDLSLVKSAINDLPRLAKFLHHGNPTICVHAMKCICLVGDESAVRTVFEYLESKLIEGSGTPPSVQRMMMEALASVEPQGLERTLIGLVDRGSRHFKATAWTEIISCLASIGTDSAVKALADALLCLGAEGVFDVSGNLKGNALAICKYLENVRTSGKSRTKRDRAATVMGVLGDERAAGDVLRILGCAQRYGRNGTCKLQAGASISDSDAGQSGNKLGDAHEVEEMFRLAVRAAAVLKLHDACNDIIEIARIRLPSPVLRVESLCVLAELSPHRMVVFLTEELEDRDADNRPGMYDVPYVVFQGVDKIGEEDCQHLLSAIKQRWLSEVFQKHEVKDLAIHIVQKRKRRYIEFLEGWPLGLPATVTPCSDDEFSLLRDVIRAGTRGSTGLSSDPS